MRPVCPSIPIEYCVVFEVPDGDLRANTCVKASVECEECAGRPVVRGLAVYFDDLFADIRRAEPFALQREEAEVGSRIQNP